MISYRNLNTTLKQGGLLVVLVLLVLIVTACGSAAGPATISKAILSQVEANSASAQGNPGELEAQVEAQLEAAAGKLSEVPLVEDGADAQAVDAFAVQANGEGAAAAAEAALTAVQAVQEPPQTLAEQPAEAANQPLQAAASDPSQAMGGGQEAAAAAGVETAPVQEPAAQPVAPNLESKAEVGFMAPDFSLQTLDGKTVRLADLRGRAVVISYWATWCNPCKAELPILQKLQAEFASQGLVVLTVNAIEQDNLGEVQALAGQMGLNLPVLLDAENYFQATYKQMFFPTSYYIDANGVIRYIKLGDAPEAEMRTKLELLINNQL